MSSTPTWSAENLLVEAPESGQCIYGRPIQFIKVYHGLYDTCRAAAVYRGTLGSGGTSGYICDHSEVVRTKGNLGKLTIVWESSVWAGGGAGQQLPHDEAAFQPFNLGPRVERHPIFQTGYYALTTSKQRQLVQFALDAPTVAAQDEFVAQFTVPGQTLLYDLKSQGHDVYYLAGIQYTWIHHHWTMPTISKGGVMETPGGPFASYIPAGSGWLREADQAQESNGVFAVTTIWVGALSGWWPAILYA